MRTLDDAAVGQVRKLPEPPRIIPNRSSQTPMAADEDPSWLQRAMRYASFAVPTLVFAGFILNLLIKFTDRYLIAGLVIFGFSCAIGRFLHRRSENLEAQLFYVRVSPDDSEGTNASVDGAALVASAAFVFFAISLPYVPEFWGALFSR
jgi:hypothetical protein